MSRVEVRRITHEGITFVLVSSLNPALCPVCCERCSEIWCHQITRTRLAPIACPACADPVSLKEEA